MHRRHLCCTQALSACARDGLTLELVTATSALLRLLAIMISRIAASWPAGAADNTGPA